MFSDDDLYPSTYSMHEPQTYEDDSAGSFIACLIGCVLIVTAIFAGVVWLI